MRDGPLDMRMDPEAELTAREIVNRWPQKKLEQLFCELGEEMRWKKAAQAIIEARRKHHIETTEQLSHILVDALRSSVRGKLHPATLVFQALRLCVNDEMGAIKEGILQAIDKLSPGGRVGVISFHSLEDRIVKTVFKEASFIAKKEKL